MTKLVSWLVLLLLVCACQNTDPLTVTVTNLSDLDRNDELIEVSMPEVAKRLELEDTAEIVVLDRVGNPIDYQITYDEKLIFPVSVRAKSAAQFTVQVRSGMQTDPVMTVVCGRQYPEQGNDVVWENDLMAFRCLGSADRADSLKAYGYDAWLKNNADLVAEDRFEKGDGLDCYANGSMLGDGASALMDTDSTFIYPSCYKRFEVLENGPLRYTMRLVFPPVKVGVDSTVVETRTISLDKGSYLNKTVLTYSNLRQNVKLGSGLVLRTEAPRTYAFDKEEGYVAYADPTRCPLDSVASLFVGCVFPGQLMDAKALLFGSKEISTSAIGHVVGISDYQPGVEFVYYWGAASSLTGMQSQSEWVQYLRHFAAKARNPLIVTIK